MYLVLNKKSKFYQLIYFKDGKRTSVSTGTADKIEADKFLNGFDPAIIKKPSTTKNINVTLSSFADEYKTYVKNTFSIKYLKKAVHPSFSVFQKYLPDMPLEQISSKIIDQFISSVAAHSKFSASLYYRTIKAAFNKAVTWNYINENPFNNIKAPKTTKSYPAFITFDELQIIISNTEKEFLKPLFSTAFFTGMRLGELVNMKWHWIDFQNNFITIKCDESFTTKNKSERFIPINQTLKNILLSIQPKVININKDDFVFSNSIGIKLNEDFVSKIFKRAVRQSKLNNKIRFHSLRHSFCSNLVQKGVSLYVVKDLAGHQNIKTTQTCPTSGGFIPTCKIKTCLPNADKMDAVNLL